MTIDLSVCYFKYYTVSFCFIVGMKNLEIEEAQPIFDCCKEANVEDSCLYHCDYSRGILLSVGYRDANHDVQKCIRYYPTIVVCLQKG